MASKNMRFNNREIGVAIAALEEYPKGSAAVKDQVNSLRIRFSELRGSTLVMSKEERALLESAVTQYVPSVTALFLLAKLRVSS